MRTPRTSGCWLRKQKPALGLVLVVEPLGEVEQAGFVERGALRAPGTLMSKFWPG